MITASKISLSYGTQVLFKDVNIKFTPGNCYGIIGANGAGKSTFLKILSGEIEPDTGEVIITPGQRMAVLRQDHFAFNNYTIMDTVIMGYKKLYDIMKEREAIYLTLSLNLLSLADGKPKQMPEFFLTVLEFLFQCMKS